MVVYGNRQKRNSVRASKQLRFVAIIETFNEHQALWIVNEATLIRKSIFILFFILFDALILL